MGQPASVQRRSTSEVGRSNKWFWIAAVLAGVVLRLALLPLAPRYTYTPDHDDFVRWGLQAARHGVLTLYTAPPERVPMHSWNQGAWQIRTRTLDRVCNYPPLSTYLFWTSGVLLAATGYAEPINTVLSHAAFSIWGLLADGALAAGCAAIVHRFRPGAAAHWTFLLTLITPVFWWDSIIWGQFDTVVLAPAVWMVWALLARRWWLAGMLWGLALALKPQAVLFAPVWALALLHGGAHLRIVAAAGLALAVFLLPAVPHMLFAPIPSNPPAAAADNLPALLQHPAWAWFRLSYWDNFFGTYANYTTLKAFNIWYLDALRTESLDAAAPWLGISRNHWGKLLLALALLSGFVYALRRWRRDARALLWWTTLTLLAFVTLPTNVHERYLILVLPFLGAAAALARRFWPGLLLLTIVLMAQLTWPLWLTNPAGRWGGALGTRAQIIQRYEQRVAHTAPEHRGQLPPLERELQPWRERYFSSRRESVGAEWVFTLLGLAGAGATIAALLTVRLQPPSSPVPAGP